MVFTVEQSDKDEFSGPHIHSFSTACSVTENLYRIIQHSSQCLHVEYRHQLEVYIKPDRSGLLWVKRVNRGCYCAKNIKASFGL